MLATKVQTAKSDISDIKIVYFKRKLQIGSATEISTPVAVGKKILSKRQKCHLLSCAERYTIKYCYFILNQFLLSSFDYYALIVKCCFTG